MNNKKDFLGLSMQHFVENFALIGETLCAIINQSLEEVEFPESWKQSVVIPVDKVRNTTRCEEFRPINVLSNHEKLLEKTVAEQLTDYIKKKGIVIEEQSGFREGYSCESSVVCTLQQWRLFIDQKQKVMAVFIDLKRAFEIINRDILLNNKFS